MQEDLKALKKWIKSGGNVALLAGKLNYSSSETIHQWIKRGNIPKHMRLSVKKEIQK